MGSLLVGFHPLQQCSCHSMEPSRGPPGPPPGSLANLELHTLPCSHGTVKWAGWTLLLRGSSYRGRCLKAPSGASEVNLPRPFSANLTPRISGLAPGLPSPPEALPPGNSHLSSAPALLGAAGAASGSSAPAEVKLPWHRDDESRSPSRCPIAKDFQQYALWVVNRKTP